MTILTKAATPVKGTATLFTLDKAALVALGSVAADPYFSDSANWKSVSLVYSSSVGNQHEIVKFDATKSSPTSKFLVSEYARDVFLIQKIVIKDFDGGAFEVQSSELTTAEFDVDMTVASSIFEWDTLLTNTITNGGGELHRVSFAGWGSGAYFSEAQTSDFNFTGVLTSMGSGENIMIGYKKSLPVSFSGNPAESVSSALYADVGTVRHYQGYTDSASGIASTPSIIGANNFEIGRIGSSIIAKMNGVTIFTDNYSGALYLAALLYNGGSIASATLI